MSKILDRAVQITANDKNKSLKQALLDGDFAPAVLDQKVALPNVTEWQSYTPTIEGFGTVSNVSAYWRQVGSNHEYNIKFTAGTVSATQARVGLAENKTISSIVGSLKRVGSGNRSGNTGHPVVLAQGGLSYLNFSNSAATNNSTALNGDGIVGSGETLSFFASVPINGLTATKTDTIRLTQAGLIQEVDSMIKLDTANGYGSTSGNKIRRFSNIRETKGSSVTYIDSATDGASFRIEEDGLYHISYADVGNTAMGYGLTLNSTELTTAIFSTSLPTRLQAVVSHAAENPASCSWSGTLKAGDIIRPHTDGAGQPAIPARASFTIAKIGTLKQVNVNPNQKAKIPTHEVRLEQASTRGTTDTMIVKFLDQKLIKGDGFTIASDDALGTRITVQKKGILSVSCGLYVNGAESFIGVTKNQANRTVFSTASGELIAKGYSNSAGDGGCAGSIEVNVGDVIRVQSYHVPFGNGAGNFLNLHLQEQEVAVSVSNTLPVFTESDSSVRVDTANGYGSSSSKARRFTNMRLNAGGAITYTDSATEGAYFTINEDGIYHISYTDSFTGQEAFGITVNAPHSTDILSLPLDKVLANSTTSDANFNDNISWQGKLKAGDIVRTNANSAFAVGTQNKTSFTISKVGKPNLTSVDVSPFTRSQFTEKEIITHTAAASTALDQAGEMRFVLSNLSTTGKGILHIEDDATNTRTKFVALKKCTVDVNFSTYQDANNNFNTIHKNGVMVMRGSQQANTSSFVSGVISLEAGEFLTVGTSGGSSANNSQPAYLLIEAEANSENIVTPVESFSTDTAQLTFSSTYTLDTLKDAPVGTYITYTYAASSNTRTQSTTAPTQTAADMNINGIRIFNRAFSAASSAGDPAIVAIQIGKGHKGIEQLGFNGVGKTTSANLDWNENGNTKYGMPFRVYNETTGVLLLDAGYTPNGGNAAGVFLDQSGNAISSAYVVVNASKSPALAGVPQLLPRIATINEQQPSGTAGGTVTATTWETRRLNTLSDPTGIVTSLAANAFTLPAGQYYIDAQCPVMKTGMSKIRLRNTTDGTTAIVGNSHHSRTTEENSVVPMLMGHVTISSPKTFEVQQYSAGAGNYVYASSSGEVEVYSQVKIQKVK